MAPCFVLEVQRFKISSELWKNSKSRRIVAFTEGLYKNKVVKSADSKLYNGSRYVLPWNENLQKVQINLYFIDDLLTVDIGTALYNVSEDGKFNTDAPTDITLKIYPMGGTVPVGRVLVTVSVQPMFDDEQPVAHVPKKPVMDHNFAVPGFRFKRLSRVLHWERIRALNLSQTVQNSDVRTLLTCLDDVTTGDVSQEDIDPQLYKALQLAQYSSQYLLSSRKVMKDKESVLKMALKTFAEEEELLDLKLAKLRARDKALKRESRDLDDLTVEYSSALREVNPNLVNRLYKTYQEKLRQPSADELARLAEADLRNWEGDERSRSPREEPRHLHKYGREGRRQHGGRSPDWESEQYHHGDDGVATKESWRTGSVGDAPHAHRPRDPSSASTEQQPPSGDHYTWSRGSAHSKPKSAAAAPTKPAWESVQDPRSAPNESDHRGQQRPQLGQAQLQAGWKSTAEVSHRSGPTAVPRSDKLDVPHVDVTAVESDYDSDKERDRIEKSNAANLKRLASKSEFVKPVSPPAQPMIRTLSMRSVAVSSDVSGGDSGKSFTPQPSIPTTPLSAGTSAVQPVGAMGTTPPLRKPTVSQSVEFADKAWNASNPLDPQPTSSKAVPTVQQSTGEISTTTAMSVDSLSVPAVRAAPQPAPAAFQRNPADRSSIDDLANNSESYEGVDMASFIQASRLNETNPSFASTGYGNDVGISERVASTEADHDLAGDSAVTPGVQHQWSDDADASLMVEEFDDSVHMDHHLVPTRAVHTDPQAKAVHVNQSTHSTALPPLSASKNTPKRDFNFQDKHDDDRDHEGSEDYSYSVEGDSPFQNLSGGKDYNRLMRQNHSHISSSNNSSSRNLSSLVQNNSNSNLLSRSVMSQNSNTDGGNNASASYEFDAFEDEDDPFARSGPRSGPRKTIEFSHISGASTDVDASKSILIDFMLPSESKDPQRGSEGMADFKQHSQAARAEHKSYQRDQSYDEKDTSSDIGLFSPLARPRSSGRLGGRPDDDEDDVLMGTTKISFGNTANNNFSRTGQGSGLGSSRNNSTGQFEKDSLAGTGNSMGNSVGNSVGDGRPLSSFSPGMDTAERDRDDTADTEDESIPPPTYDAMIGAGTGGTEDSYLRASNVSNVSQSNMSQSQDVSSYFENSADAVTAPALHIHAIESTTSGVQGPVWALGRAAVDAVELATALDVFVSAVRLDSQHARIYSEIQIKVEFLGIMSELSGVVDIGRTESVQPVSFSAHLLFTAEQEKLLEEEISQQDDAICCYVHVVDAITQEIVGSASVELWVMIEDAVNILRQEVEVLNLDMSHEMGSAVVDVKGFRLLKKCAAALRSRRNVG